MAAAKPEGANQVFVLGDDQPVTWKQLLGEIAARIGASPPRLSLPFGPTRVLAKAVERLWARLPTSLPPPLTEYRVLLAGRDLCFFAHKARRVLGFAPKVRLEEALDRTAAWFLSAGGPHGGIRPPRRA